jgi:hypothetical protein
MKLIAKKNHTTILTRNDRGALEELQTLLAA